MELGQTRVIRSATPQLARDSAQIRLPAATSQFKPRLVSHAYWRSIESNSTFASQPHDHLTIPLMRSPNPSRGIRRFALPVALVLTAVAVFVVLGITGSSTSTTPLAKTQKGKTVVYTYSNTGKVLAKATEERYSGIEDGRAVSASIVPSTASPRARLKQPVKFWPTVALDISTTAKLLSSRNMVAANRRSAPAYALGNGTRGSTAASTSSPRARSKQ